MIEYRDEKKQKRDIIVFLWFSIITAIISNFQILFFLDELGSDKQYFVLLLMVFVQLGVFLYVHFALKNKAAFIELSSAQGFSIASTFVLGLLFYLAYLDNILGATLLILLFLSLLIHYLGTMGNQSIFYSYFQSWEWKPCWKDNDIKRIAGDHQSIIKKALINFVLIRNYDCYSEGLSVG